MRLYHRTFQAHKILADGFKDAEGTYGTGQRWRGVFLSDRPLNGNEGAYGDAVLVLSIPVERIRDYEWVEQGKRYREFHIPADIVNRYGPPRLSKDT